MLFLLSMSSVYKDQLEGEKIMDFSFSHTIHHNKFVLTKSSLNNYIWR
jgi:hypothetical protein